MELAQQFEFLHFEEEEETEETRTFFLHEGKEKIVELFRNVFRFYTREENTVLDSSVILEVLKEEKLPLTENLQDLSHLWFGYFSVIQERSNARKSQ